VKPERKKKDKNAPKGAKSAYLFFCDENRAIAQQEYPDKKMTELASILGDKWKALTEIEKEKYNDMAGKDKLRAKASKDEYEANKGSDEEDDGRKKKRKKKDENAPKKNLTGFFIFSNDLRPRMKEENPGLSIGDMGRQLGEKWKILDAQEKAIYKKRADEDKGRYDEELAAYKKTKRENGEESEDKPAAKKVKVASKPEQVEGSPVKLKTQVLIK